MATQDWFLADRSHVSQDMTEKQKTRLSMVTLVIKYFKTSLIAEE